MRGDVDGIRVPAMRRIVVSLHDERPVWTIPGWAVAELRAALDPGWQLEVVRAPVSGAGDGGGSPPELLRAVRGAEVLVGMGLPRDVFLAATAPPDGRLRWVHTATAGVGSALFPEILASDVVLTNSAGVHGPAMAETVMAMALHFARGLDAAVRAQAERRWDVDTFYGGRVTLGEVAGATMGIVGLGGVGREVARRALELGMHVVAVRRRGTEAPAGVELLTGPDALARMLPRVDYLVLTVPGTPETRGLIGAAELARLGPGAVLINVARGAVVDEDALVDALRAGRLRGAGLDVFRREPLPADSPLWNLPNVLILPHVSATTPHFWRREIDLVVDNLRRYQDGRPLRNIVDKSAGY